VRCVFTLIKQRISSRCHALQERFLRWIKPSTTSLLLGTLADMTRGKSDLFAENALLRHHLIILRRQIKQPVSLKTARVLLVVLARMVRTWKQALFLIQPETLLRGPRERFRLCWKHTAKTRSSKPRLSFETITLIKQVAAQNHLWGAERIHGELLKLDIRERKRTIQKYLKHVRPKRACGQTWRTFWHTHAAEVWACDCLQVTDLFFRPLVAFFNTLAEVAEGDPGTCDTNASRSLGGATDARSDSVWANPKYLMRDNDKKFGPSCVRVATPSGIKVLRTPSRTRPRQCCL
jgi:putative transposase